MRDYVADLADRAAHELRSALQEAMAGPRWPEVRQWLDNLIEPVNDSHFRIDRPRMTEEAVYMTAICNLTAQRRPRPRLSGWALTSSIYDASCSREEARIGIAGQIRAIAAGGNAN
jgi:hypothetical protein